MKALRKFIGLTFADKVLAAEVLACVVVARALLSLAPFRRILAWSQYWAQAAGEPPQGEAAEKVEKNLAYLVGAIGRRVPMATCLTQALALQFLLARRGLHSEMHIGVGKEGGDFRAHAWLETRHGVIIGGTRRLGAYRPILSSSAHR